MNNNDYNYIAGRFYCSNVGTKYHMYGNSADSYYAWDVNFESVKVSAYGIIAEFQDADGYQWECGLNSSGHPYLYKYAWGTSNTVTFSNLTVSLNSWTAIRWRQTSSSQDYGDDIVCTVNGSSQTQTSWVRWNTSDPYYLAVGNSYTTIRGIVTVKGYPSGSNTLNTATFDLDSLAVGATSMTTNGNTFSCPAVQKYLSTYTVSYNANGGSGTVASQTKTYGTTLTLRSSGYTKDGFTLSGWTKGSTSGASYALGGSYTDNEATTMYAKWTANTYTVSFNANGGSGSQSSMTKTGGVALTLPSSTTFTYTGRHITKWRLNSASGTEYNLGGSYTTNADATFYAKWEYNTYTVVFNANGGSGTMANESMTYGTYKNLTSNAFTKSGHRFLGWATSSSGAVVYTDGQSVRNLTTTNNGTVTLYAVWQSAGVRVKHNGTWKTGQVYVKHNGEWKIGRVYAKHNGSWKEGT